MSCKELLFIESLKHHIQIRDKEIEKLSKKSEILEENNKLLIQQKSQLYKDLDIAYERIDKAIEYIETENSIGNEIEYTTRLLDILRGGENENNS